MNPMEFIVTALTIEFTEYRLKTKEYRKYTAIHPAENRV